MSLMAKEAQLQWDSIQFNKLGSRTSRGPSLWPK